MNENVSTGPKIFLKRLADSNFNVPGVALVNPDIVSVTKAKQLDTLIVGRLDGTSYYDFSKGSLKNFLLLRSKKRLSLIASVLPDMFLTQGFNFRINRYLDRTNLWLLKNADALVFQSHLSLEMHKKFLSFKEQDKSFTIIHNGVDTRVFTPKNDRKRASDKLDLIISGSLYRAHKRLADAVNLTNILSNVYAGVKLHILGDLDSLASQTICKLDKSRCIFYGKVHYNALPEFYQKADLQLQLSMFDPCPNVVVEGLSCGLPVITPLESGASELVGVENSNWVVKENLTMRYHNLHTSAGIPKIPLDKYVTAVKAVVDNLHENQMKARKRAEQALDIMLIAQQYKKFLKNVKDRHG